jgi:hypothetical protein
MTAPNTPHPVSMLDDPRLPYPARLEGWTDLAAWLRTLEKPQLEAYCAEALTRAHELQQRLHALEPRPSGVVYDWELLTPENARQLAMTHHTATPNILRRVLLAWRKDRTQLDALRGETPHLTDDLLLEHT